MAAILRLERVSEIFFARQGIFSPPKKLMAVDDVSLEIAQGECLGLVGESGCGKSTLGRLACGLLSPSKGRIFFHDKILPPAGAGSWCSGKIQMIFQDPASSLNPRMSVLTAVAEPLLAQGKKSDRECKKIAKDILELVGLENVEGRYPHQFSGGQRQRIAIARALVTEPDLIICDEPVSALDASVQAQILNLLKDMQTRFQPAYLFISHDLAVIGFMCARIIVMYLGRLVEKVNRDDLFEHAAHPYTRALLEAMPQGAQAWTQGKQALPPPLSGELPSPLNPPTGCYFHPRCPRAKAICAKEAPDWRQMGQEWQVRCHFPVM